MKISMLFAGLFFLAPSVSLVGQAYLLSGTNRVELHKQWMNTWDNSYVLVYPKGKYTVPFGSGVYFESDGGVSVVHFSKISGPEAAIYRFQDKDITINGIAFDNKGNVQAIWLSEPTPISLKDQNGATHTYSVDRSYCAADPFGYGTVEFFADGTVSMVLVEEGTLVELGTKAYPATGWVTFSRGGAISSLRLVKPELFETKYGTFEIASLGFYQDLNVQFVTIKESMVETKYGSLSADKTLDFYPSGALFVMHIVGEVNFGNKVLKDTWVGFEENGDLLGEMQWVDEDWAIKK